MEEFPPFIYGTMTIRQYVTQVIEEKKDVKCEIIALVDFISKTAQFPFDDNEQTFLYINACCKAIRGLTMS